MSHFKDTYWVKGASLGWYGGPMQPAVKGWIEQGRGTTEILLALDDDQLRELARCAAYVLSEPDTDQRGHAYWHSANPKSEYPCDQCSEAVKAKVGQWMRRLDDLPKLSPSSQKGSGR